MTTEALHSCPSVCPLSHHLASWEIKVIFQEQFLGTKSRTHEKSRPLGVALLACWRELEVVILKVFGMREEKERTLATLFLAYSYVTTHNSDSTVNKLRQEEKERYGVCNSPRFYCFSLTYN